MNIFEEISYNSLAKEIYKILKTEEYKFTTKIYDKEGNESLYPDTARWIYVTPINIMIRLPRGASTEPDEVFIWKSHITQGEFLNNLIQRVRKTTNLYGVGLTVRDFSKELDIKDFAELIKADKVDKELNETLELFMNDQIDEGLTGSSRSSYLVLDDTKLIIRHANKIDEEVHGSRSRNIKSIFVENANGERLKLPSNYLLGARALLKHVNESGVFNDKVSYEIMEMSKQMDSMRSFVTDCSFNQELTEACKKRMKKIKESLRSMQREKLYGLIAEELKKSPRVSKIDIAEQALKIKTELGGRYSNVHESAINYLARERVIASRMLSEDLHGSMALLLEDDGQADLKKVAAKLAKGDFSLVPKPPKWPHVDLLRDSNMKMASIADWIANSILDDDVSVVMSRLAEKFLNHELDADRVHALNKLMSKAVENVRTKLYSRKKSQMVEFVELEELANSFTPEKVLGLDSRINETNSSLSPLSLPPKKCGVCEKEECECDCEVNESHDRLTYVRSLIADATIGLKIKNAKEIYDFVWDQDPSITKEEFRQALKSKVSEAIFGKHRHKEHRQMKTFEEFGKKKGKKIP